MQFSRSIIALLLFFAASCGDQAKNTTTKPTKPQETEVVDQTNEGSEPKKEESKRKTILFFGDSLTAGLGLEEEEAFPALIQNRLDSLDKPFQVINAGLSGETSAGGKGRIEWVLNRPVDIFILELGANDMLRGLDLKETDKNLRAIFDTVKEMNPEATLIVAGMEAPANMGPEYTSGFKNMYQQLATDYNAALIPFLLEGLLGKEDMSIGDGKHPNAEGQKIVRENVWDVLQEYI